MLELVFQTPLQDTDWISDCLMSAGALAVTVEDAQSDEGEESPIFAEPGMATDVQAWPHSTLVALLAADSNAMAFWQRAVALEPRLQAIAFDLRSVAEKDWVHETQRQFSPFLIDNELWIGPSWMQPPNDLAQRDRAIWIDPGMAFGTASHATTQLCLEQMAQISKAHGPLGRVLDVGCGSGILSIAAAKLGAKEVIGTDIDPQAIQTATDNAKANRAQVRLISADASAPGRFDLVVANILCQPLKVLAPALMASLNDQGFLLLSGILSRQADEIIKVYQPLCAKKGVVAVLAEREGWICIGMMGKPA